MKKAVFLAGLASVLLAADSLPPVPDVGHAEQRRQTLSQCKVPPHTVVLPPMVEPDWRDCANRYFRPDPREAAYSLELMLRAEVVVNRIETAPGFLRAYEIDAVVNKKPMSFLCDENVNRCYAIGKVYMKPEQKDKK